MRWYMKVELLYCSVLKIPLTFLTLVICELMELIELTSAYIILGADGRHCQLSTLIEESQSSDVEE